MDKTLNPEQFKDYSLFIFFKTDEEVGTLSQTILAKHYNEAIEYVRLDFKPDAYQEIKLRNALEMVKHFWDQKHPRPIVLADNNDFKEI